MDVTVQIQWTCSNDLWEFKKLYNCGILFRTEKEDSCMQRQYQEFSCMSCSNKEGNHCLTFSTWPRTCERTQSRSCRHQPNRRAAFSSKGSTRRPTGRAKLERGQRGECGEQRRGNMELLNNDVISNATKTNDRIRHYVADSQRCITLRFP